LYRAADAIDASGGARDLADALFADLFGLREREGVRQSLFCYFHGRSSLATWLRAVLSQRQVDRLRAGRRLAPLPDDDARTVASALPVRSADAPDPDRPRYLDAIRMALTAAIAALVPRDRLRLTLYYAQDLTLSAIGRLLNEHEATVSRHLTRTRRTIRATVEQCLRGDHGFDETLIAECFQSIVDDVGPLDLEDLVGATPDAGLNAEQSEAPRKNKSQDRSK
jgi:RNA polymerase sigma factor (sigma-70 family)